MKNIMTNTDRLDADLIEPIRWASVDIPKAQNLAAVLFDHSVAYSDFRYEAAQQINALLLTVSNLEFEIETCKKSLTESDQKSEVLRSERDEYRRSWREWLESNDGLEIRVWLLAYSDATPEPSDSDEAEAICGFIDRKMIAAAAEIKRLREEEAP